jgi:TonB family protein
MIKWFKGLVMVFMLVFVSSVLSAGEGKIAVELRFYQGFHENGNSSAARVGSYYLKKIADDKIIPFMKREEEALKLKEIYKLKKVKRLDSLKIIFRESKSPDKPQEFKTNILLNGRTLILRVYTIVGQKDRFGIGILEKGEKERVLLESEVIVPEEKTAVLGFKDSEEKIYFLAFNRKSTWDHPGLKGKKSIQYPKLRYYLDPEYPQEALKQKLVGNVMVSLRTDNDGNVVHAEFLQGPPLLKKAVKEAVLKWKYSPWKIDGIKKPVDFSIIFIFRLKKDDASLPKEYTKKLVNRFKELVKDKKSKRELPAILEMVLVPVEKEQPKKEISKKEQTLAEKLGAKSVEAPKLIRRAEPQYPAVALEANIEGDVILRGKTDTDGNVEEVKVLSGHPLLRLPAVNAARQWKYLPWKVDGTAHPVEFTLVVIYRAKKIPADKINPLVKEVLDRSKQLLEKEKKKDKKIPALLEVILVEKK